MGKGAVGCSKIWGRAVGGADADGGGGMCSRRWDGANGGGKGGGGGGAEDMVTGDLG